jgi:hypothetical protein
MRRDCDVASEGLQCVSLDLSSFHENDLATAGAKRPQAQADSASKSFDHHFRQSALVVCGMQPSFSYWPLNGPLTPSMLDQSYGSVFHVLMA